MIRLFVLLFVLNIPVVQAHGSSHYICKSERVGYDRIDHCTSYDNPVPDVQYTGYYTDEQIQKREERTALAGNILTGFGIFLMVVFGIMTLGLILA
jgi:hypothetical protein